MQINTKNTVEIEWELVFKLKEFYKYLNREDLIELGYSSKHTFNQLKCLLLSNLYILNTNKFITESFKYKDKIRDNYKLINSIYVSMKIPIVRLSKLLNYFNDIRVLSLCSQLFELDFINSVFANLQQLSCLKLNRVKISVSLSTINNSGNCDLLVPLSLTKLVLKSCSSYVYKDKNSSGVRAIVETYLYCTFCTISKLEFLNLQYLSIIESNSYGHHFINSYLTNNANLKELSVEFSEFNEISFKLISNLKLLKYLTLFRCSDSLLDFSNIEFFKFNSIKSLNLDQTIYKRNFDHVYRMSLFCPNIEYLKLIYNPAHIRLIEKLTSVFSQLKNLVLEAKNPPNNLNLNLKHNNTIRNLDLINFKFNKIRFDRFNTLEALNVIRITHNSMPGGFSSDEEIKQNIKQPGWNSILIDSAVIYSKIK